MCNGSYRQVRAVFCILPSRFLRKYDSKLNFPHESGGFYLFVKLEFGGVVVSFCYNILN